jgi:2-C-methyl-D-erythritol 4-phosphate cytidylyltransferase
VASERTAAIIAAAGRGERMGAGGNKLFLPFGDRPVLAHTLGVFEACPVVDEVVVAVGEGEEDFVRHEVISAFDLRKVTGIVRGGATRQESVGLALRFIGAAAAVIVVHDGARPLLPLSLLEQAVALGRQHGAIVVGLPAKDTLKRVSGEPAAGISAPTAGAAGISQFPPTGGSRLVRVTGTLDRREIWQVQTPQVFWRDLLQMAHRRAFEKGLLATDEGTLVELLGHSVLALAGSEENLKITTPLDLVMARAILADRARRRPA